MTDPKEQNAEKARTMKKEKLAEYKELIKFDKLPQTKKEALLFTSDMSDYEECLRQLAKLCKG